MAEQPAQERTEQPTDKRRREAREKGQVARSRELTLLLSLLVSAGGLLLLGPAMLKHFSFYFRDALKLSWQDSMQTSALSEQLGFATIEALQLLTPLLALAFVASLVAPLALGGFAFSTKSLQFKADKLNPLSGLKRIFSAQGLSELAKAVLKVVLIGIAGWISIYALVPELSSMAVWSTTQATMHTLQLMVLQALVLSFVLVPIVLFDVPFQIWSHTRQLRMTRQEVKDEMKDTDGRPEVKSRIRSLQQQAAARSLMKVMPTADVVITNPTHFAVALRYDSEGAGAPVVVAKGVDEMAQVIRQLAALNQVRVCPLPALARVLYWNVDEGSEVPPLLYLAVARVLAWVYQVDAGLAEAEAEPPEVEIPRQFEQDITR